MIPHFTEYVSGIEAGTRVFRYRSDVVIMKKDSEFNFTESNFLWADGSIFNVFTIPLISGDSSSALVNPNTVIVSQSIARKYFGDEYPVGQLLTNATFNSDFVITGIFKDFPGSSHFRADFICSLTTLRNQWGEGIMTSWTNSFLYSYITASADAGKSRLEQQINLLMDEKVKLPDGMDFTLSLQPLTDIHLHSNLMNELEPNGNVMYVYILGGVALLILLVSCINFVNLGIARSEQRSREIGVRKVLGSQNRHISFQVLLENILYGSVAFAICFGLISFNSSDHQ